MDLDYGFGSKILMLGKTKIDFNKVPLTQYIDGAIQPLLMSDNKYNKQAVKDLCGAINELHKKNK